MVQKRRTFLAGAAACACSALLLHCAPRSSDRQSPSRKPELDIPPPPVPRAADAHRHAGEKLLFLAESLGIGAAIDRALALRFYEDTGVVVSVVPRPREATETYASYQRLFQARSADVDVVSLDVTWPGTFAPHLFDLAPILGDAATHHLDAAVRSVTVGGRLVAMPYFSDFGILFYRADLLDVHGYDRPPATWDDLEAMARRIQTAERTKNRAFVGFVWQGKAYEGLTCNALEWIFSSCGGRILEDRTPTINNPNAARALARARGYIRTISPVGVLGYAEEDARNVFQAGNAVFMRNWPYAWAAGNAKGSRIAGLFDVAPLPHEPGCESAATLGGWTIGVSKYSRSPEAAARFAGYLCSPEVQRYRALAGGYIPTIPAVQREPDVASALPFLEKVAGATLVARPSAEAGPRYNEVSIAVYQGVSKALYGTPPADALRMIERRIRRALREEGK